MRDWYEPWELMCEMIIYLLGAMLCLVMDTFVHFAGEIVPAKHITYDFKKRLYMAYTTVPDYLKQIKISNEEVDKHGYKVHKQKL
jgi:hypothetical protein